MARILFVCSSNNYEDELCWGALWLYRATGEQSYLNRAMEFRPHGTPWAYSWDAKEAGSLVSSKDEALSG